MIIRYFIRSSIIKTFKWGFNVYKINKVLQDILF